MGSLADVSSLACWFAATGRTATPDYASHTALSTSKVTLASQSMTMMTTAATLSILLIISSPVNAVFLFVSLILVLHIFESRRFSRFSRYHSTRYPELDGLSAFEIIIEWVAALITTVHRRTYSYILAHTRGASVINFATKRILIAHPSMERSLGRHVNATSLAHNTTFFGSAMFDLSAEGIQRIKSYDPRPVHKEGFSGSDKSRRLVSLAAEFAQNRIDREPDIQETVLGDWLFKIINTTLIAAIWGAQNPWVADEDGFVDRFVTFTYLLPTLLRPWQSITARRALKARDDVLSQLRSFHSKNRESFTGQLGHRINVVTMTDPLWEANDDYFKVELLSVQGLTVTPSAMTVWLMRHLLSDQETLQRVISQVRRIDAASLGRGKMDVDSVEKRCPLLVASLYEAMRLHMTAIPRIAKEDFEMPMAGAAPGSMLQAKKGDIIILPMTSFNLNPAAWGSNVGRFVPGRFLASDGSVSGAALRRLRVFGVASNMCPGRKLGLHAALFVAATVLRTFDIEPAAGITQEGRFPPPKASNEPGVGFERVGDDVRVTIRRIRN